MASRLLDRLDAAITRCRDPVHAACLKAERAAFLGRQGRTEPARRQLRQLQRQFEQRPHAAVSGWLALAEGQLDHYHRLGGLAHDRFQRAHALSRAAQLRDLQARAAAWLSFSAESRGDFVCMAALAAEALAQAAADAHAARWRAALTVAGAYHFAGQEARALPWYAAARRHALADGDEVALSALMHNQAAVRAQRARWAAAFAGADPSGAALHAVLGAESTGHFDAGIGQHALAWLVPLLRAQLLVQVGRHAEALASFDREAERAEPSWRDRMAPCLLADRAWALFHTGRPDAAHDAARQSVAALSAACDADDRALAHARLAQVWSALGEVGPAAAHRTAAELDRGVHDAAQARVVDLLDAALTGHDPAA